MPIPSKFPDHECKNCKIMIKKGDPVNLIDKTGKWCSNPLCPEPPGAAEESTGPAQPAEEKPEEPVKDENQDDFEKFVKNENSIICKIEKIVEAEMQSKSDGPINGQKVGMHVKEIYRTFTNNEWKKLEHGLD